MDEYVSQSEHKEFVKRLDEENRRQDKRIELLEQNIQQLHSLTTSVERLAINIQNMVKVQEQQGERLQHLEGMDGKKWRKAVGYVGSAAIGVIVGWILKQIGIF